MKVCETCEIEIDGKDGENQCASCEEKDARLKARNKATKARIQAMKDLGLTRVKGALGGTYWE